MYVASGTCFSAAAKFLSHVFLVDARPVAPPIVGSPTKIALFSPLSALFPVLKV